MQNSIIHMPLDLTRTQHQWQIECIRGNTAREIHLRLHTEGVPFILTNDVNAIIIITKPDGTTVINDCMTEIGGSEVVYELSSQAVSATGLCSCQLQLSDGVKIIATPVFNMFVSNRNLSYSGVVSESDLSSLTNAIAQAENIDVKAGTTTVDGKEKKYIDITDRTGNTTRVIVEEYNAIITKDEAKFVDVNTGNGFYGHRCGFESELDSANNLISYVNTYTSRFQDANRINGYINVEGLMSSGAKLPAVFKLDHKRGVNALGVLLYNGEVYVPETNMLASPLVCIDAYNEGTYLNVYLSVDTITGRQTHFFKMDYRTEELVTYECRPMLNWTSALNRFSTKGDSSNLWRRIYDIESKYVTSANLGEKLTEYVDEHKEELKGDPGPKGDPGETTYVENPYNDSLLKEELETLKGDVKNRLDTISDMLDTLILMAGGDLNEVNDY